MPPSLPDQARRFMESGDLESAETTLRRHLQRAPTDTLSLRLLAVILSARGDTTQAEFFASRAAALEPRNPDALLLHANTLASLSRWTESLPLFRRATELAPASWQAWAGLAHAALECHCAAESHAAAAHALAINPAIASHFERSARALRESGIADQSRQLISRGLAVTPADIPLLTNLVLSSTYSDTTSPEQIASACRRAGSRIAAACTPFAHEPPSHRQRLRIAYLSSDFRTHSVSYFIEPILHHHKHQDFEVFAYSTGTPDSTTARLQPLADHWLDARELSDDQLADRIRADAIDILIDLNGYSDGNRLGVLARRPAPIQVTYLGWPTSTGLPTVYYRLVDSITDPVASQPHSTESLIRLDPCFLCYQPPAEAPTPAPRPANRPVVFGSFNAHFKISLRTITLWSQVLKAVPNSRLIIKAAGLSQPTIRRRLLDSFRQHSIPAQRLELLDRLASKSDHLALYNHIDIALDTFPYNGTTTTCEALFMNTPVIALRGPSHPSRVSASILSALAATELIADAEPDYITIAASLASNRPALNQLHATLRTRMLASPLCDAAAFTSRLESAYRLMWRQHAHATTTVLP